MAQLANWVGWEVGFQSASTGLLVLSEISSNDLSWTVNPREILSTQRWRGATASHAAASIAMFRIFYHRALTEE